MRKVVLHLFVVAIMTMTGCAVRPPPAPTPEPPEPTPVVVYQTVEVPGPERIVEVLVTPTPGQVQPEPTVAPGVQAFGPTSGGAQVLTDWPRTAEEFVRLVTAGQPQPPTGPDPAWLPLEVQEVHQAVKEPWTFSVNREKDLDGNIVPFWVNIWTPFPQDGWMHFLQDRQVLGRADGSGIPSGFQGWVQGVTMRPDEPRLAGTEVSEPLASSQSFGPTVGMAVQPATQVAQSTVQTPTVVPTTPVPTVPVPTVSPATGTLWSEQAVRELFQLSSSVVLAKCPGEANCWQAVGEVFQISNPTSCWQDGYRAEAGTLRPGFTDPKVGIPPNFSGLVGGATLRPCP